MSQELENAAVEEQTSLPLGDQVTDVDTGADDAPASSAPKTAKEQIRDAIKEVRAREQQRSPKQAKAPAERKESAPAAQTPGERARDQATGRFTKAEQDAQAAAAEAAGAAPQQVPPQSQDAQSATATTASGPPPSLSKEVKAIWESLPPAVQTEFARREADTQKGIEKLKQQFQQTIEPYRQVEQVIAPHRARYQQHGVRSDAEAIHRLMQWEGWIRSNPREALAALAQQYGVQSSTLAQPGVQTEQQGQAAPQGESGVPLWLQEIFNQMNGLSQQVQTVTSEYDRERNNRVSKELSAFAADKPYFDRVKVQMGMMMQQAADLAEKGMGEPIDLQTAYDRACWADEGIRTEILQDREEKAELARKAKAQEEENKRKADKERRLAAAKAASVSPRGSPPSAVNGAHRKPHSHSVRDSILAAKSDLDGRA